MKSFTVALALVALVFSTGPRPLLAEEVSAGDAGAIRSVIESQIEAFLADDGAAAYSFAAPSIQRMFPSIEQFMFMVRNGYEPVYRPQSYAFEGARSNDGTVIQEVSIKGPDGRLWTALYSLEQQDDGSWRISGCQLLKFRGADV